MAETNRKAQLTTTAGIPVADNQNGVTAGPRGPLVVQDLWVLRDTLGLTGTKTMSNDESTRPRRRNAKDRRKAPAEERAWSPAW